MKTLLIRPPYMVERYEPPLGICYLAGYLKAHGKEVEILDGEVDLTVEDIIREMRQRKPDVVGISMLTYDRFAGYRIAKAAKEAGAFVVVGNVHPTFTDRETLQEHPYIDAVVRHEGEATLLELVQRLEAGKPVDDVQGLTFRNSGGEIIQNPERELLPDVDKLPYPAYDLVPMKKYRYHAVFASRGCPYKCIFCSSPNFWLRKVRYRTPVQVVNEIELLLTKYGKKDVHFKDDVFTMKKQWVTEILNEMQRRNIRTQWECMGRVNNVDPEFLHFIKKMGCTQIEYGVESGDPELMEAIEKSISPEKALKALAASHEAGIHVGTFFMIGHPGETLQSAERTFDFALQLRPYTWTFSPADILPGTKMEAIAREKGLMDGFSWSQPGLNTSGEPMRRFTNPEVPEGKMVELAHRFHARMIFCRLFDIRRRSDWWVLFRGPMTPYYITPRSRKELGWMWEDFLYSIRKSPSIARKALGFVVLVPFTGRFLGNSFKRLAIRTLEHLPGGRRTKVNPKLLSGATDHGSVMYMGKRDLEVIAGPPPQN
jgi:radical SAM superfamily enzyme YgiQ (UPF0313 family)